MNADMALFYFIVFGILFSPAIPVLGLIISKRNRSAWLIALVVTGLMSLGLLALAPMVVSWS